MILVDSSIWVDHIRRNNPVLAELLNGGEVSMHPYIIGEIAMGNLTDRDRTLADLHRLPSAILAQDDEVLVLISRYRLFGRGIGYVDAHLLAATLLTPGTSLWTRDRRLHAVAANLGMVATPPR